MENLINVPEIFGSNVFNDRVMKERLPKAIYREFKELSDEGKPMSGEMANVIANAMKDWAIEKGATHYTHWFQPLTGITAEKHDSFISPTDDGGVILEFSGRQLIQGEPDASSFPSGGLRATFEARGYTAWDSTVPAFIKDNAAGDVTLYIPTAFHSYTGVALDKKIPVLRSMSAVSKHALRILKAIGNTTTKRVTATLGPEQEYFLIDRNFFLNRLDLMMCGRTLFGAPSPKGQELEDQYFGSIKDKISAFMGDLDIELWKMGIASKTRHNEVAPGQFENAPVFTTLNIAIDHNQLVMDMLQKVALRHGLICLLHEKPYKGINGSGKHNNWSLSTDDGQNLLEPGENPHDNMQFLIFLAALIRAVDKHADLLRGSCATAGQDHRLGANEAPPAIISVFLGNILTEILEKIGNGGKYESKGVSFLKVGVDSLPPIPMDNSDRNRTSPFAFTGNKFEFRMVGSSMSCAGPNIVLNTIAAETFDEFATRLEKAKDINAEAAAIIKQVMKENSRVIFNGNNYSSEWEIEAGKRGLPNIKNCVDAHKAFTTERAGELFSAYKVLSKEELHSRYEIYIDQYAKTINIEANCAIRMVKTQFLPAGIRYAGILADSLAKVKAAGASASVQADILKDVSGLLESASAKLKNLEAAKAAACDICDCTKKAESYRDNVFTLYTELRDDIDRLEAIVPADIWPVPTYSEMLFKL
ncbi:MAG TPA: glutamine synthetase type III [bacterium]|nr:glutamine synthetase type III [bacterium]